MFELRPDDDTKIFVKKVNEAGLLQNKYYDELQEYEKPAPEQIVRFCHPPRTQTARMYVVSKKTDADRGKEADKK